MDQKLMLMTLVIAMASGCAATRTREDGTTDVVYRAPRTSELPERLAGGGIGLLTGAVAGAAGAVVLTGGDPQASLYVSVLTVPAGAAIGLFAGLGNPAWVSSGLQVGVPPTPAVAQASAPHVSPEVQSLVRTIAYEVKHRRDDKNRKRR